MLHRLRLIPAFDLREARLLYCFLYASHVDLGMSEHVVREFLVQQRSVIFHGLLCIENERKFLVFDALFQYGKSLLGSDLILCDHGADIIAVEQRMIRHDNAVGNVLMARIC